MYNAVVGIDVSKDRLDVVWLTAAQDASPIYYKTANTASGHERLLAWLGKHQQEPSAWVCLEATSIYGDGVALCLHQAGYRVSIVNPLRVKRFGESQLMRVKTDKTDAALIARFCQSQQPVAWTPPSDAQRELRELVRGLEDLDQGMLQLLHRRQTLSSSWLAELELAAVLRLASSRRLLNERIAEHAELSRVVKLLCSIDGIGQKTAWVLVAELGDLSHFASARQLVAYVGIAPRLWQSGRRVRGGSPLCKLGNAIVRKALYWPAISATRYNPAVKALYERLLAAGKPKMVAIGAAMHKLLRQIYGVVRSGQPFERSYQRTATVPQAQ